MSSKDAVDADSELAIIREFFDNVDLDCSGYIDETELAAVVDLPPHEIKEIFKKLDTDGDGRISIEEFTENYKHFQSYAEQLGKNSHNNNEFSIEDSRHSLTPKQRGAERDGGYATAEPMHRKNHPLIQTDIKRKAAKFLGQEYLDDLYEVARSRDDPMLLESLENFLTATVESLLQKQADNEKLDTALKRATEKSTEMTAQLEEEMEHQVAVMEQKFRQEEQAKLEQQKHEANVQLMMANNELEEMERKIVDLENKIVDQAKKDAEIPDHFIDKIRKKDLENQQLQQRLLDFQTQMSVMRTEVSAMKSEYDEQSSRLENERGTVLSCVQEQESLTRQLQLLHEANKKLHDTNDDLRSALDVKRSNSMMSTTETSPVKRSASCAYPRPFTSHDQLSSFRSDPGAIRNSTMNNDLNDTDEDSAGQSIPRDEDDDDDADVINERSLLKELMTAENQRSYDNPILGALPRSQSMMSSQHGSYLNTSTGVLSDRDQFLRQLEMLSETNRRLGESNDELRNALSLLSDQVRSERGSDTMSLRQSPQGCYSAPVTPFRENYQEERPNSTSSPRKVLLTKSGYNPMSMYARHQSDEEVDEDDMPDEELIRLVDQTNEDSASLTDEPITVEEKILEPLRYPAVGSSEGESVSSVNTGHGEPDEMFKLVLAGNAAVGKSSFIIRLSKNKFYSALNSTLGVDFQMKTLEVDQQNIALQLWDTAGQERFRSIAKSYFRRVDGVILLYDVTCESSFLDVRDWIESIESSSSNKVPIILCGNKVDLRAQALKIGMPVVTRAQGRQLANEVGALFIETSAKDGTNIHKACKDLIRLMQKVEEEDEKPTGMTLENNTAVNKPKKAGCCRS